MEELKQEIVITVTEADFKRHNPNLDIDEMRLHNFAERLMRIVQNRLDSLDERYHTCISTEPPQAEKSPWIPITPETMPEEIRREYWVIADCGPDIAEWYYHRTAGWMFSCASAGITHYQPITLPIPPIE